MTTDDHVYIVSELRALVNELEAAASRTQIRAEYVAMVAASTRAERVLRVIEDDI